ncbi:MAG: tryptophan synthase subunit alpha, partial [Thermacetogeniaceae bacterium]
TPQRLDRIGQLAQGFVYCVSLTGVTGARQGLPPDIEEFMERARARTTQPLAIGFGISSPEQAALMAKLGDAVIVGSAIVSLVEQYAADREQMLERVASLVQSLKQAISPAD